MSIDRHDARLLDMRLEEEHDLERRERAFKDGFTEGAPPIPNAQLVYSPAGAIGVAVAGARFVCPLPKQYVGPHVELALIDRDRLIVTHPNHPPLLIDPQRGTTQPL